MRPAAQPVVFVVDDDPAMRDSLRWLIESTGVRVETYPDAQTFLDAVRSDMPGCLVLDVRMPGMSGLDLQSELARRGIGLPTIVVTGHAEVPMAVRAVKAGALDFIEKPFSDQLLLDRVRQGIEMDRHEREARERRGEAVRRLGLLTQREREVLDLVVAGKPNKEIAVVLRLSPKTVEVHRAHVMEKMQASSVAELVRLAILAQPTTR
ncbi:MAG TPA: response regulator [Candidatus Eisenbacteria bacterium]|nr:response regulator [Candidatus Eisenbacteria bacterium]